MAKFLFFISFVIFFTLWLYLLHYFAPSLEVDEQIGGKLKYPSNLKELQDVAFILKSYSVNHWWYVFLIFSSAYIYKQSFCIPGSIFLTFLELKQKVIQKNHDKLKIPRSLIKFITSKAEMNEYKQNLLAGALYGQIGGLIFACLFTAVGASICYFISLTIAKDLVHYYFSKRIGSFKERVKKNEDNLLYFMLFVRLVPITPGWVINLVAPLVDIPYVIFLITTFFGLGPYNFVGVSAGGMLASLKSINDIFTWKVLLNITLIGLVAICPAYFIKKLSFHSSKVSVKNN